MKSARFVAGGVVAGTVVALAVALAVAAFLFQSDTTAAAPAMEGMSMTSGAAYWQSVGGGAFHSDGSHAHVLHRRRPGGLGLRAAAAATGSPASRSTTSPTRIRQAGPGRIGSTLREVPLPRVHRRDRSRTLQGAPADDRQYLGLLGPVIRAEVGDTIKVVFRNNAARSRQRAPARRLLHEEQRGRAVQRRHRAAPTRPTTPCRPAARTPTPGRCPSAPGPGPGDGSSVMWMYHSHTDEVADTNAGLMGPIDDHRPRHGPAGRHARRTSTARSSPSSP